jgi:chemotaxis signal transduction protein
MKVERTPSSARAGELRRDFDRSFAEPPRSGRDEFEALLRLRVGGDPYAIKVAEVTGLIADRLIVSLPAAAPEFLGIVGLRGSVVPVWSLSALLGYPASAEVPRWLILVGGDGNRQALGLAFEQYDGHLSVPRAALSGDGASGQEVPARSFVGQSVRLANAQIGVLSISSMANGIRQRLGLENGQAKTKDR